MKPRASWSAVWRMAETLAWSVGVLSLAVWAVAGVSAAAGTRREMRAFAASRAAESLLVDRPDQSSRSAARPSLRAPGETAAAPLAVLRIPRIALEAPVLAGTDEWTLDRAVGHISGTAVPGGEGNSGMAAHRDGLFRRLGELGAGDLIEVETLRGTERFRVDRTWVVERNDVSVLDSTASPSVTLVTCYPFKFIGSAPRRYIVRAVRIEAAAQGGSVSERRGR